MLTSYLVRCPYPGCDWFGSLLPSQNAELWRGSVPNTSTAVFECPNCGHTWHARVQGDDVFPMSVEEELEVI